MKLKSLIHGLLIMTTVSCQPGKQEVTQNDTYPDIKVVGAMKNVMWKGELGSKINLDTISNKTGLYGLGPLSYLRGELLLVNGKSFVSKVVVDSTMIVEESFDVSAPFFVYTNVSDWREVELPVTIKTIQDLEKFIDDTTKEAKRPFAFKVVGKVESASIHIQNLPMGAKVSSPDEAHQGQRSFALNNSIVEIIGFFSKEHKGIFTHHDTFLHMHLITDDKSKMGHLDELRIDKMKIYLPNK